MNRTRNITAVLLLAALGGAASAQSALSRAQVEAELAAAIRNGDMVESSGLRQRDIHPDLYPKAAAPQHVSRAQVRAELAAATRNGDMSVAGNGSVRAKDLEPGLYPAAPAVAGKTRQQVNDELAMAIRDGDMPADDDSGKTEYQLHPRLYAKQRALDAANPLAQQGAPRTGDATLHSNASSPLSTQ